ncbi:protein fantom, partial [Megalops cyprinoides]|uniref:protein fantom n=1 Tax=Megalops cyprinoides TaxID=118141 RepID=UPI001864780E
MSLAVDETAGDLPVRDVGLRAGLNPTMQDAGREVGSWRRPQVLKIKDRQRVFRVPREQLEEQCLRLQEENTLLRQHSRAQEQRIRRMSTKLMRLQQGRPGTSGPRDGEMEETLQELEARVATLESQKGALQNKLSLARQHILELGGRGHYRVRGRSQDGEGGVRRAAQTAPPRYGQNPTESHREEIERLQALIRSSVADTQQVRVTELESAAQSLRDTLREKEREIEDTMRELRRQQAEGHRVTIRENVDMIRLQKQLSEKSAALLVIQEKFSVLQQACESQLEESQKSIKESQEALLGKVQELTEQLKQERQRVLCLEGQLTTATFSSHALEELQERLADVEGERDLLKENYDRLLESTMSVQSRYNERPGRERERHVEESWRAELQRLEKALRAERAERERLEGERERMRHERERPEEQKANPRDASESLREKHRILEQEVLRYREEVTSLQARLDSVTKEFDMSVEELSETLLQIKAFRLQREGEQQLRSLGADGKVEDSSVDLRSLQASHAETVLELQKSRDMLLLQHRINSDLQAELQTVTDRAESEREESRKRMGEKDRLLERRAQRITILQAQLQELAYSPKNYKRTIPLQYTWAGGDQEGAEQVEDDTIFSQLRGEESLLEIHLRGAAFTPGGLRVMGTGQDRVRGGAGVQGREVVTFCTYALLDFETHSTPLISGPQPNYGFTSRYALSPRDLGELRGQGGGVRVEVHQALGGVQFVTRGQAWIPLSAALDRSERLSGKANITGPKGEILGVLEYWVRLYPPAEQTDMSTDRRLTPRGAPHSTLLWEDSVQEELFDYGGGTPNELEVVMERCVGLSTRWPGLLPDAYLLYRLYDLPPHVSPTVPCSTDPVFNDSASYPLAVTVDMLAYLQQGRLWVYAFDDSDDHPPASYLAKTPIPLRALALGRSIRGDFVLRDAGGSPRGVVRASLRWKYPFQPPEAHKRRWETDDEEKEMERHRQRPETLKRPIAKPRSKAALSKVETVTERRETQKQPRPPPIRLRQPDRATLRKSPEPGKATPHRSPDRATPLLSPEPAGSVPLRSPARKRATSLRSPEPDRATPLRSPVRERKTPRPPSRPASRRAYSRAEEVLSPGEEEEEEEEDRGDKAPLDSEASVTESSESRASSGSDVIIIPHPRRAVKKGNKLRVEILSLSFLPNSQVALDQSVHRVYVEYRLLGIPMETTETPMSLRKPTEGEEIHYNFSRVIYVDGEEAASLRQYLYTMLEGTDPNQGRLKFTVVSEPMDEEEEECVDVGHAYLDLQDVLQTGSDVIERQIDIVGVDEDREVVGMLKVSLEAAQTLRGVYWEYRNL